MKAPSSNVSDYSIIMRVTAFRPPAPFFLGGRAVTGGGSGCGGGGCLTDGGGGRGGGGSGRGGGGERGGGGLDFCDGPLAPPFCGSGGDAAPVHAAALQPLLVQSVAEPLTPENSSVIKEHSDALRDEYTWIGAPAAQLLPMSVLYSASAAPEHWAQSVRHIVSLPCQASSRLLELEATPQPGGAMMTV